MKKITILGAGAFGFAMAKVVSEKHDDKELYLFDVQEAHIHHIHEKREHPIFHEGTRLPSHIHATTDLETAVKDADLIILAIPSKFLRGAVRNFRPLITKDVLFLNLAKGLEKGTNMGVSQILRQELADTTFGYEIGCLSGGMIAREVTLENPLCADVAFANIDTAKRVAQMIENDHLRLEVRDDVVGVELSGAFKNVIAIGAGIFDGMGYSESSKSAFVSAAAKQVSELAVALGAKKETYEAGGQAWFGDLMTTCFGASRNLEFGRMIGSGKAASVAIEEMIANNKSVEGYITAEVLNTLLDRHGVQAPLLKGVYSVLYEGKDAKDFVKNFISVW